MWSPNGVTLAFHSNRTNGQFDVYTGGEDGLLGVAIDPDFEQNGFVYVYYSPASSNDADPANVMFDEDLSAPLTREFTLSASTWWSIVTTSAVGPSATTSPSAIT